MNKTLYLLLFLLSVFFFSCKKKEDTTLRKANGKINTISIIIDDQLWNGEVGDQIRNKFASPVTGLPQEEPLFSINQYSAKLMDGFTTDSRTVLVVKKENKNHYFIQKNQFATPQNVYHIYGKTTDAILEIIEKKASEIIQFSKESEIKERQRIISQSPLQPTLIQKNFKITLQIPASFAYVLHKNNFMWLKKEITSGNISLLIYEVPMSSIQKTVNPVTNIIKMRDSIGDLYIRGREINTQMITEEGYAPYFSKTKINNKEAFETKGTWELKNDFMSGPFVNYAIVDEARQRILVLEGFCYSPSKEKRDLMQELEAIIKSVEFLE